MFKKLKEFEFKISAYQLALSTMNYDAVTVAPKLSGEYRNERMSFLSGEMFKIMQSKEFSDLIYELDKQSLSLSERRIIDLYKKNLDDLKNITQEEFVEARKLSLDAFTAWEKAREKNDYSIFEPFLIKNIETITSFVKKRNNGLSVYQNLLNDFEEGMSLEQFDAFFQKIKDELVPFIKEIHSRPQINDALDNKTFSIESQKAFTNDLLDYLRYDNTFGHCSVSTHPFSSRLSQNDTRITTRYDEKHLAGNIFSVIHEVGHAMYEHQIKDEYADTMIHDSYTYGMHESQSRLFENCLGRSRAFWEYNYPRLQNRFEQLKDVSLDAFLQAVNRSEVSFIRTEADELTYPIHVLIRYEIEKEIFSGQADLKDLRNIWNQKIKEYLGIDVKDDLTGILQDVHWTEYSSFGYFPTYAIGSAYAAQIYNTMKKEIPVDEYLSSNQFEKVNAWLKENIHQHGALYTPNEILKRVTGETFNPDYYIQYLKEKYSYYYGKTTD